MEDNNSNFQNKIQNTVNKITLPCVINLIEKTQVLKKEKTKVKKNFIALKQIDQTLIGKEININQLKGYINRCNDENKSLKTKEDAINQYILKLDKKEKQLENEQLDYLNIQKEMNSINIEQTIITHILGNENKKENNLKTIKNNNSIIKNPLVTNTKKKRRFKSFNINNKLEINNSPNVFPNHKSLKSSLNLNQCSLNDGEILNKYSERKIKKKKHNSYQKNKSLTISSKVLNNENSFECDISNNSLKGNKNKTISSPKFSNNSINNGREKYRNLDKYLSNGKKKYSTTTNISLPSKQLKYTTKNSDSSINSSIVVNKNKNNSRSVEKQLKENLNLNIKSPASKKNVIKSNNKLYKNKSVDCSQKIDITNDDIYIKTYKNKKNSNHLKTDVDFNKKNNKFMGKKLKTASNIRESSIDKEKELKLSPKKTQTITVSIHKEKNNINNKNKINSQRGIPKNKNVIKNNKEEKNNKIKKNNSYEKKKSIIKKQNNKLQKTKFSNLLLSVFKKNILRRKKEFFSLLKIKKRQKKTIEKNKIKQIIKKFYILTLIKEINIFLNSKKNLENDNLENNNKNEEESIYNNKENIDLKDNLNSEKINNPEIKIFEDKDLNILLNNYLSENGVNGKNISTQYDSKKYLESLNQIKNIAKETKNIEKNIQNFLLNMTEEKEISTN